MDSLERLVRQSLLEDNADLIGARFMSKSLGCVEWIEDLVELLCRYVRSGGDVSAWEDENKLRLLVEEELAGFGLLGSDVVDVVKLLWHLLAPAHLRRKKRSSEECAPLVEWLYAATRLGDAASLSCLRVSELEFAEMKVKRPPYIDMCLK